MVTSLALPSAKWVVLALAAAGALASAAPTCLAARAGAASAGAANPACPGDDTGLKLPGGFCATIFADGIGHARHLVVSTEGVVYANTWSGRYYHDDAPHDGGFLVAMHDTSGSGKADIVRRFGETPASGGHGGTGMALFAGSLYAESDDKIVKYHLGANVIPPPGPPETVVFGLPLNGDHPMHPMAIDAGGNLYVDSGSASNSCQAQDRTLDSPGLRPCQELETRGGVWRFDAAKTEQAFSPAQRYATGIRNAEGYALDAAGSRVFVTQHGRDQLHSTFPNVIKAAEQEATLPAEELLLLEKDGDYGWPYCYFDPFQKKLVLAPEYGGDGRRSGECATKLRPVAVFPAHWAPNAAVYYDRQQFPARYRNGVFIAFHGSWNRAPYAQAGYNVVFQSVSGGGARCEIFATGFAGSTVSPSKAAHRPAGLAVGPDGALYVADDVQGRIYKITYRGGTAPPGRPIACPNANANANVIRKSN